MIHRARSFLYSTALPPASVGAALAALEILRTSPDLGAMLLSRARLFRRALEAAGLNTMRSESHIIPLLIGDNGAAVRFSVRLKERGILATAIREPTVPRGTARIRLSATLCIARRICAWAARIIAEVAGAEGLL